MSRENVIALVGSIIMIAIFIALGYMALPDCDDGTIVKGMFWFECINKGDGHG